MDQSETPTCAPDPSGALHDCGRPGADAVTVLRLPAVDDHALLIHGGAGASPGSIDAEQADAYRRGLKSALSAGETVLVEGGSALDAVIAAVRSLEDCRHFNAGRGAALTTEGVAELDAAVMTGEGVAGAVTCVRDVRNPVTAARAVAERTPHVLMAAPSPRLLDDWGCERVGADYFLTERRLAQLQETGRFEEYRHGTVGAVARDRAGHVAAATSTGGVTAQLPGRIGDTPVIGAGTWADARTCAVSCTGTGEHFLRAALAHDVHARMAYAGASLAEAARAAIAEGLGARGGDGALIAVTPDGEGVLAWNSAMLLRGALTPEGHLTHP